MRRRPNQALSSLSRPTAVKGLVGLGLASSVAAAVAIPGQAATGDFELPAEASAMMARDRAEVARADTTSRSTGRTAVAEKVALTAPAAAKGAKVAAGTAGVTAVAKPKPKPEVQAETASQDEGKDSSGQRSSSSAKVAVPTGTGSGAYYSWCRSKGLGGNASTVCSAVRSNFGLTNIGGYRAGAGDHGTGRAVDVMVSGSTGDAVAQWAINNMSRLNITYVIWKQRIWLAGKSGWRHMEDRGSATANHYDHVHISVE